MKSECPYCAVRYEIDDCYLGTTVTCPQCRKSFVVKMKQPEQPQAVVQPGAQVTGKTGKKKIIDVVDRWFFKVMALTMFLCSILAVSTGLDRRLVNSVYPEQYDKYDYHGDLISHLHYKATLDLKYEVEKEAYRNGIRSSHQEAVLYFILAGVLFSGSMIVSTMIYIDRRRRE